jgi:hypothetical protein
MVCRCLQSVRKALSLYSNSLTVFLTSPTMVTDEYARRSCMNPSQWIHGGTNWKVSLFIYAHIVHCFHQITNTFLWDATLPLGTSANSTMMKMICLRSFTAIPAVLSYHMLIPHLGQRHVTPHLHGSPGWSTRLNQWHWIQRLNDTVYTVPQKWASQSIPKWR